MSRNSKLVESVKGFIDRPRRPMESLGLAIGATVTTMSAIWLVCTPQAVEATFGDSPQVKKAGKVEAEAFARYKNLRPTDKFRIAYLGDKTILEVSATKRDATGLRKYLLPGVEYAYTGSDCLATTSYNLGEGAPLPQILDDELYVYSSQTNEPALVFEGVRDGEILRPGDVFTSQELVANNCPTVFELKRPTYAPLQ